MHAHAHTHALTHTHTHTCCLVFADLVWNSRFFRCQVLRGRGCELLAINQRQREGAGWGGERSPLLSSSIHSWWKETDRHPHTSLQWKSKWRTEAKHKQKINTLYLFSSWEEVRSITYIIIENPVRNDDVLFEYNIYCIYNIYCE